MLFEKPFSNVVCFPFFPLQSAIRLNENVTKINQLKDDQEECETKLEKERDIYASNMFDLLAEEDNISSYIINYVKCKQHSLADSLSLSVIMQLIYYVFLTDQQLFYKSALKEIETLMTDMNSLISKCWNYKCYHSWVRGGGISFNRGAGNRVKLCINR